MDFNNIERNQLDYILTDVLPTELSEQFSYRYLYEYLISKLNEINKISKLIIKFKNGNKEVFSGNKNWISMPLGYTIMKQLHSERSISLLQPLGVLQLYLFICAYQKEIISLLQKNSVYTLRCHKKNNDLYYRNKKSDVTEYFADISENIGKEIIEQTGIFFKIGPYKSIAAFTSSEDWLVLNSKYKYFIKIDYKSCFDSIYTHTFNWIIGKDVNDTKNFKNSSIYSTIDRVLMNINARTSNGIVVGPEFSRMVAEILLQTIDRDVYSMLLNKSILVNENYNVYRFVDDIFIFADSEKLANEIVELYSDASRKYLLRLNDSKLTRNKVPFVLESWLNDTNLFTNRAVSLLFNSQKEQKKYVKSHQSSNGEECVLPYLLKSEILSTIKRTIMRQFNELICKHESKDKTIVSYFLGAMLNKVGRNKKTVRILEENPPENAIFNFFELVLYVYSFFPDYNNTQKLLSIISYIKDEFDIFKSRDKLQDLFNKYSFIFEKANLNDIVNLFLFCHQVKIEISYRQEEKIVKQLDDKDDPILWASYLLYSQYNHNYFINIKNIIEETLIERIDAIVKKDSIYTYREFWWVLIFNKSPHISPEIQDKINTVIPDILTETNGNPGSLLGNIFLDFLKNNDKQFFEWDINDTDFLRSITFKTRQRSIFKNYQENLRALNWSSM